MPYHVTKKKNIKSILEKGLIPQIGDNSLTCGDDRPEAVWICNREDVPYWMILTDSDAVISVADNIFEEAEHKNIKIMQHSYNGRREYGIMSKIPTKYLSEAESPSKEELEAANDKLAEDYMLMISQYVEQLLQLGESFPVRKDKHSKEAAGIIKENTENLQKLLSRINFKEADISGMRRNLAWQIYDFGQDTFVDRLDIIGEKRRYEYLEAVGGPAGKVARGFKKFLEKHIPDEILHVDMGSLKQYLVQEVENEENI